MSESASESPTNQLNRLLVSRCLYLTFANHGLFTVTSLQLLLMLINVYNTSEKAIVGEWVGEWTLFLFVCGSSERTNERTEERSWTAVSIHFIQFQCTVCSLFCWWWSLVVVVGGRWLWWSVVVGGLWSLVFGRWSFRLVGWLWLVIGGGRGCCCCCCCCWFVIKAMNRLLPRGACCCYCCKSYCCC